MADFRKWLPALAVAALALGSAGTASAQITVPNALAFGCTSNAGVPPIVRAEGLTELVGDLVLNCTGGQPTPVGVAVPQVNIQIFLNTNVTSRLTADPWSEALLLIDEPAPANQVGCTSAPCPLNGIFVNTVSPGATGINYAVPTAPENGTNSVRNVYQGRQSGANSIVWLGVPVDPPGTTRTRILRITNIRANANQLGVSSTLIPTQIVMFVSATGSTSIPINNPQQIVAFVQVGLVDFAFRSPTNNDATHPDLKSFVQCVNANRDLSTDNTGSYGETRTSRATIQPPESQDGRTGLLRYREGFASSFKRKNLVLAASPFTVQPADLDQDTPSTIYNTETGFLNQDLTSTNGMNTAGRADHGTRLLARFNNVPSGVAIYVGNLAVSPSSATLSVRRVTTDANGAGTFSPTTATSTGSEPVGGLAPVTISGGTGVAVWEVMNSDPLAVETVFMPVAIAYTANTASNLPGLGTITVNGSFAPLSTVGTASASAPIPRFADTSVARTVATISSCQTNLLWPFVTNQGGFDTGMVIANTSLDTGKTWGPTVPQAGSCKICYYGGTTGGGEAPASQTTQVIPAGRQAVWTLSSGGNFGITATPGFQGYIIAQCFFQYGHGYAFISDVGAQRLAQGYLALVLDAAIPTRTRQRSEVLGF